MKDQLAVFQAIRYIFLNIFLEFTSKMLNSARINKNLEFRNKFANALNRQHVRLPN